MVAKKGSTLGNGVFEPADSFMAKWHRDEADRGWLRHGPEYAEDRGMWLGGGAGSRSDTAIG